MPLMAGTPAPPSVTVDLEVRTRVGGYEWNTIASGDVTTTTPDAVPVIAAKLRELADQLEADARGE